MSQQSDGSADPFHGRQATSHERQAGVPWDASYTHGLAPWDIGSPQPAVVRLANEGAFEEPILDAGCGTGENALYIASLGLSVTGVDVAATALELARAKADADGIFVDFVEADALGLEELGERFETVLDCGLFHSFDAEERLRYAVSLAAVTEVGGTLYVLCFRPAGTDSGPHPLEHSELAAALDPGTGWQIVTVEPDVIETRFGPDGVPAWLVTVRRV